MSVFQDLVKFGDELKNGIELAATDTAKAGEWLLKNKTILTGLAGLAGPTAQTITVNALALYDKAAATVQSAGVAATANGINVSLDQATIAGIVADLEAVKNFKV